MFSQFDVSFLRCLLKYIPNQFFYHIWKNYKIGLQEKLGEGGVGGGGFWTPPSSIPPSGLPHNSTFQWHEN